MTPHHRTRSMVIAVLCQIRRCHHHKTHVPHVRNHFHWSSARSRYRVADAIKTVDYDCEWGGLEKTSSAQLLCDEPVPD